MEGLPLTIRGCPPRLEKEASRSRGVSFARRNDIYCTCSFDESDPADENAFARTNRPGRNVRACPSELAVDAEADGGDANLQKGFKTV